MMLNIGKKRILTIMVYRCASAITQVMKQTLSDYCQSRIKP